MLGNFRGGKKKSQIKRNINKGGLVETNGKPGFVDNMSRDRSTGVAVFDQTIYQQLCGRMLKRRVISLVEEKSSRTDCR